jgi:dihydrofolate reductase
MLSIIVVVGENGAIGKNGKLIWDIPSDLKRFKEITTGHTIVMGRKTYESIGKLLPNRRNVILSSNKAYKVQGAEMYYSWKDVLIKYQNIEEEIFVIGGEMIYEQALPFVNKLCITLVYDSPNDADVFFPKYSESKIFSNYFKKIYTKKFRENGLEGEFLELVRIKNYEHKKY